MLRMAESNVCAIFLVKGEFYDHRNGSYRAHGKECGIQEVIQSLCWKLAATTLTLS
jgi:hypothetical protein